MNKVAIFSFLVLVFSYSCNQDTRKPVSDGPSLFTEDIRNYYFTTLDSAIFYLDQMDTSHSPERNKELFMHSRKWYKMSEPMMMAYDYANYTTVNGPNLLKVEIEDYTDIKKLQPRSYQVIEEVLFAEEPIDRSNLHLTLVFLKARLPFIKKNHMLYRQWDQHHLKMVRDAIVNVATKGITGFDSPALANSQQEAIYTYQSLRKIFYIYEEAFSSKELFEAWMQEIDSAIKELQQDDFETFDRYTFIKEHTNRQLKLIKMTENDWGISMNRSRNLNPSSTNLFAADFFNMSMFRPHGSPAPSEERKALGAKLFNDPNLSNSGLSCGSCHVKEKAFTDGQPKASGKDGVVLPRNTPTLTYAVYQSTFFYDGTGDGLEGQIVSVVNNPKEFHIDLKTIEKRVADNPEYQEAFEALYDGKITNQNVRNAIATYIRGLAPFNSKFDRNIQGKESSLTDHEIKGFNLFMGKAACATCHFPPAFNGTVPPRYTETEFENLGVPANADFEHPRLDDDPGMYYPYEVEEKRHFFKTSTVRNAALTAPYMHNGVYQTLEEVIQFYDVGGGLGMGLDVPHQTLPPDSLHLTNDEKAAIIAFMHTLTDSAQSESPMRIALN